MKQWIRQNTTIPAWMPTSISHTWAIYVMTLFVQILATVLTGLLLLAIPNFSFRGALLIIGATVLSHIFGFVPGTVASLLGAGCVDYFLTPPTFAISLDKISDVATAIFYLVVCLTTAWFARAPSTSATNAT